MSASAQKLAAENFSFSSSVAADVWHPKKSASAYEWWYFDALSDDASEAIVIIFLDNFVFSPRYNTREFKNPEAERAANLRERISRRLFNSKSKIQNPKSKFPAVAFVYYRDGKPLYRAINEFPETDFEASEKKPECRIGDCSFTYETESYGSGYLININAKLSRERRLEAHFEWLSVESDFAVESPKTVEAAHSWNLVAPRSDVSGKITIYDKKGASLDSRAFRGTGYHDHNLDNRWLPDTVREWHWGRVHFADATAVFYRYCETGSNAPTTKLLVVRDGELHECETVYEESAFERDKFGIKYPAQMRFASENGSFLLVKHKKVIDSSFFYLRFLSEMTLVLPDGKPRQTVGITEHLAPAALKRRYLDFLINMRIGRNGKGSFLP
jgi:carotenoid 1,2-hydratase